MRQHLLLLLLPVACLQLCWAENGPAPHVVGVAPAAATVVTVSAALLLLLRLLLLLLLPPPQQPLLAAENKAAGGPELPLCAHTE